MQIYLLERDPEKIKYLSLYFEGENIKILNDDFSDFMKDNKEKIQCVVSPANSFGLMDGGFDLALSKWFLTSEKK